MIQLPRPEDVLAEADSDRVALIAFEVDDQSPEDLAIALDHVRAQPAVLDVVQIPALGKKGRMTAHIQVLAQPEAAEQVIAIAAAGHREALRQSFLED